MNDEKCSITSEQLVNDFCRFLPKREVEKPKQLLEERVFNSFVTAVQEDNDVVLDCCKENPKSVSDTRGVDADIFSIDRRIKEEFDRAKKDIPEMEKRKKRLEWIKNNAVNKIERIKAENEIFNITKNMISVVKEENKREYVERTKDILNEITEIMSTPVVRSFISSQQNNAEDNTKKIRELFQLYFSIASKFTHIDPCTLPLSSNESRYICDECNNDVFDISEEGKRECSECGKIVDVIEMHLTYKDTERINLIPRYNYSKDGHFRSAIDKFQGKQNKTIPSEVYKVIHDEIDKYDIYTRETITKLAIYDILSQNGFGDYYEDINLIHSVVSGIPPPDISMYKSSLIDMNTEFEKVYDKIKIKLGRDNALNVNHKLTNFLEILGYHANEEDLIGLKTRNKKIEHDDAMRYAFEILGWITMWRT